MKLTLHRLRLPLEYEFTIARGSTSVQPSLIVELEHDGHHGYGEVTENEYYGHTLDSMSESILGCRDAIESYRFGRPDELWRQLREPLGQDLFALSAIDLAAYDLFGKLNGRPTYEVLGLSWDSVPESSYTIGIDSIEQMVAKLQARSDWTIFKIKLGTDHDVEIVRALRETTSAVFRVDANCGWTAEQTVENSDQLKALGVEFIEQPLPADAPAEQHRHVFEHSKLPVIADESCQVESDVRACVGRFHGVNVKLCKCGGLTPAIRMLREARGLGLKTMVGCMVESSVGISAAAQLLPILDYADLDGAELLARDAAEGITISAGTVSRGSAAGSGITFCPNGDLVEKETC